MTPNRTFVSITESLRVAGNPSIMQWQISQLGIINVFVYFSVVFGRSPLLIPTRENKNKKLLDLSFFEQELMMTNTLFFNYFTKNYWYYLSVQEKAVFHYFHRLLGVSYLLFEELTGYYFFSLTSKQQQQQQKNDVYLGVEWFVIYLSRLNKVVLHDD